jgi:hypothetical protein
VSDDRKYRQRGYQDSGRPQDRSRAPQEPRPKPEGPRGRGLGAPTETVFKCNACGTRQVLGAEVAPDAACAKCGAALHSCSNCSHFDTSARWECRVWQTVPERIVKKRAANACPSYTPKTVQEFGKEERSDPSDPSDPRAAFDALFKL